MISHTEVFNKNQDDNPNKPCGLEVMGFGAQYLRLRQGASEK